MTLWKVTSVGTTHTPASWIYELKPQAREGLALLLRNV